MQRESLKWDPKIRAILNEIWEVVDDDQSGAIEFYEYVVMNMKIYRGKLLECIDSVKVETKVLN